MEAARRGIIIMTNRKALRAYVALLKCEVGNLEDRPGGESQRLARERRREKIEAVARSFDAIDGGHREPSPPMRRSRSGGPMVRPA
jgi:hypothetical protein